MDPVFEIITDQSSNYLLLFFYPIFPLFLFLFISHYLKKRCPWTPSMTGDAWTWSMKVVYGPGPKWGSMDPWSIIAFSLTVAFFIHSFSKP